LSPSLQQHSQKKGNDNKLVAIAHFHFKQKEKKMGNINKLAVVALLTITTKEK
jgi:hypothetical protein